MHNFFVAFDLMVPFQLDLAIEFPKHVSDVVRAQVLRVAHEEDGMLFKDLQVPFDLDLHRLGMAMVEEVLKGAALHLEKLDKVNFEMPQEIIMVLAKSQNLEHGLDLGLHVLSEGEVHWGGTLLVSK